MPETKVCERCTQPYECAENKGLAARQRHCKTCARLVRRERETQRAREARHAERARLGPVAEAGTFEKLFPETQQLLGVVKAILEKETDADGSRTITVRSIMYKLISNVFGEQNLVKTSADYRKVQDHVRSARVRGDAGFEDERFNDAKRVLDENSGWDSFERYVEFIKDAYHCDPWKTQAQFPMILVEKNTIADAIKPVTQKYKVPLFISQGYFSRPFLCKIAERIKKTQRAGRLACVGYIGDHDPSGFNMEECAKAGKEGRVGVKIRHGLTEILGDEYVLPYWERLAVTTEQFEDLPDTLRIDVKEAEWDEEGTVVKGDTRAADYIENYKTNRCAEVEALTTEFLQDTVEQFILGCRDDVSWDAALEQEKADCARLAGLSISE